MGQIPKKRSPSRWPVAGQQQVNKPPQRSVPISTGYSALQMPTLCLRAGFYYRSLKMTLLGMSIQGLRVLSIRFKRDWTLDSFHIRSARTKRGCWCSCCRASGWADRSSHFYEGYWLNFSNIYPWNLWLQSKYKFHHSQLAPSTILWGLMLFPFQNFCLFVYKTIPWPKSNRAY